MNNLEEAFFRRYGKKVNISRTYDLNEDKTFKQVTVRFETPKGNHYVLNEIYKENTNDTDYVLLCYTKDDRKFEHKHNRYIDAEISLVDKISEEEYGNT